LDKLRKRKILTTAGTGERIELTQRHKGTKGRRETEKMLWTLRKRKSERGELTQRHKGTKLEWTNVLENRNLNDGGIRIIKNLSEQK